MITNEQLVTAGDLRERICGHGRLVVIQGIENSHL